jgi:hypothetical protein
MSDSKGVKGFAQIPLAAYGHEVEEVTDRLMLSSHLTKTIA